MNRKQEYLQDALHLKSAEFWLKLGRPTDALAELEGVSVSGPMLASVLKLRLAALSAVREQGDLAA